MRQPPTLRYCVRSLVTACLLLGSIVPIRAEEDSQTGASSEIEQTEESDPIVERFFSVLKKTPRHGTAFDHVWAFYVDQGRMPELMDRCRENAKNASGDPNAWILLGLMESRRGKDDLALEAFEKAQALDAANPFPAYYRGTTLLATGRLREAAQAFEAAAANKPKRHDFLRILNLLGRTYERLGETEEAKKTWQRVERAFPGDLSVLEQIAQTMEEEERLDEALPRYQTLAKKATENYDRVRFALSAADLKVRLGRKSDAREDFEALLDGLSPKSWLFTAVRDRIELIFIREADEAGLARYYESWLTKHPKDLDAIRRFAGTLVRLGRVVEARERLESAVALAPSDVELRQALIDLLVATKEYADAQAQYAALNEIDPGNPDVIRDWGLAVMEDKTLPEKERREQAAKVWQRLLEAKEDDPQSMVLVAELLVGGKMPDRAEAFYKRAVEAAPNEPRYREYLGFFYYSQKRKQEAIAALEGIAEGDRKSSDTLSHLARLLSSMGYVEESLAPAHEAAEAASEVFHLAHAYVRLLLRVERTGEAEAWVEKARRLAKTDDEREAILKNEIELLGLTGTLKKTAEELRATLTTGPQDATALDWWRLAALRRALGEKAKAAEAIKEAAKADPDSLLIAVAAARIHEQLGELDRAAKARTRLAAIDPVGRIDHLKHLVHIRMRQGKQEEALKTAGQIMAGAPGDPDSYRLYAGIARQVDRYDLAVKALRRAVQVDPADNGLLSALADALAESGELNDAVEVEWRLLDRTKDLRGKLSVVTRLADFYLDIGDHGKLIQRLKQREQDPDRRREAAYCTTQAYLAVHDFQSARRCLETLMGEPGGEEDTLLLDQLSRVAEAEGDLPGAVRFQEMLYEKTKADHDRDRLASLYFAAGKNEQGERLLAAGILESDNPADQIRAVLSLLGASRYLAAHDVLKRLRTNRPDDWLLLYHEGEALARLKRLDEAAERFEALRALGLADNTPASFKKTNAAGGLPIAVPAGRPGGTRLPFEKWSDTVAVAWETILRDDQSSPYAPFSVGGGGAITYGRRYVRNPQWTPATYGEAWTASWVWSASAAFASKGPEKTDAFLKKVNQQYPIDSDDVAILARRLRVEISLSAWLTGDDSRRQDMMKVARRLAETDDAQWRISYLTLGVSHTQSWLWSRHSGLHGIRVPAETPADDLRYLARIAEDTLTQEPDLAIDPAVTLVQAMRLKGLDAEADRLRLLLRETLLAGTAGNVHHIDLVSLLAEEEDVEAGIALAEKRIDAGKWSEAHEFLLEFLCAQLRRRIPSDVRVPLGDGRFGAGGPPPTTPISRPAPPPPKTDDEKREWIARMDAFEPTLRQLFARVVEAEAAVASGKGNPSQNIRRVMPSPYYLVTASPATESFHLLSNPAIPLDQSVSNIAQSMVDARSRALCHQMARYYYALATLQSTSPRSALKPEETPPGIDRLAAWLEDELAKRSDEKERAALRRALFTVHNATGNVTEIEKAFVALIQAEKSTLKSTAIKAALKARKRDYEGAAAQLDAFKTSNAAENSERDRLILDLFDQAGRRDSLKKRARQAIDRELARKMTDRELFEFAGTLRSIGEHKDADDLMVRLLRHATDQQILCKLMEECVKKGQNKIAAKLAHRVLRQKGTSGLALGTPGGIPNPYSEQALEVLRATESLEDLAPPLEDQLRHSPGSLRLMRQLLDLYVQLDKEEDARRIAAKLEKVVHAGDDATCSKLAKVYFGLGESEKGFAWMMKALAQKPSLLLKDYYEFEKAATQSGRVKEFIALLTKIDDGTLQEESYQFDHRFDEWLQDANTHDAAMKLFERLWNIRGADRMQLMARVRARTLEESEELYPFYHELVVEALRIPRKPDTPMVHAMARALTRTAPPRSAPSPSQNPRAIHAVYSWSSSGVHAVSIGILDVIETKKDLPAFHKEIAEILAELEQTRTEAQDTSKTSIVPDQLLAAKIDAAQVLLAMIEARMGRAEEAKKRARALIEQKRAPEDQGLKDIAMVLGQELARHEASVAEAIEFYTLALGGRTPTYNPNVRHYITTPLVELYQKSEQREKIVDLLLPEIRQGIHALSKAGGRQSFRIGSRYYQVSRIVDQIDIQVRQLSESGCRATATRLVEDELLSQPWFQAMKKVTTSTSPADSSPERSNPKSECEDSN